MNIKPRTYYKRYYENYTRFDYDVYYTDDTNVYWIAYKYNGELIKHDNRIKWGTIRELQDYINSNDYKLEEISESDVFLELL